MAKRTTAKQTGKTTKAKTASKAKPKGKPSQLQKAGGNGKPGVIGSILEFLQSATAKAPLSKADLTDKLAQRFKDRSKEAMAKTVGVQVPGRLSKEKQVDVIKTSDGKFYIK